MKNRFYRLLFSSYFISIFFLSFLVPTGYASEADPTEVKIGVLAKRGSRICYERWLPTAEYLSAHIPGYSFSIIPLSFEEIIPAVENQKIDFIFANSAIYAGLEITSGASCIATMKNLLHHQESPEFGGVIFFKSDRNDIRSLEDVVGKSFMGVDRTSLGGWLMAWRELNIHGIDPERDFSQLVFGATHDAVVYAVLSGKVDVGTVRTDTLEHMAAENKIRLDDFKIIPFSHIEHHGYSADFVPQQLYKQFPYVLSTHLYPEWPFAKLRQTPDALAKKVAVALYNLPADSKAAITAKISGWTIPLQYQSVRECLKELRVWPYQDFGRIRLTDVLRKYWAFILFGALLTCGSIFISFYVARLNKALRLSRTRLKRSYGRQSASFDRIIEESLNEIYIFDAKTLKFLRVNLGARKNIGYSAEELYQMTPLDIKPEFTEEIFLEKIKSLSTGQKERLIFETIHQRRDGSRYTVEVHLQKSTYQSRLVFVAIIVDITSRKKAEEEIIRSKAEFEAIFNSITDAVVFVDQERCVVQVNPAFTKIFGYQFEELKGQTTQIVYANPDEYIAQGKKRYHKDAEVDQPVYEMEYRRKDGTVFPSETLGVEVKQEDGTRLGFLGIIRDISDRKQAEMEKSKLEGKLQQAQKMEAIGTLAGGIAHDFNNILSVIIGFSEMAKIQIEAGEKPFEDLNQISIAGKRAAKLVEQILAFSRQVDHHRQPLYPHLIVTEALKLLRSSLPTTVSLQVEIDSQCGVIMADSTNIHQMVMNLCTNALHALENEKGRICIKLCREEVQADDITESDVSPGPFIVLSVSDSGAGIDQEILDRIFDPYFTTKEKGKGTGLGLAVIYGIVKDYKGFIRVESKLNEGTTFHVYIPAMQENSTSHEKTEKALPMPRGNERILVVDDEESIVSLSKAALTRLGYTVTGITSSAEALEKIKAHPGSFDLVVTDQTMPVLTGAELAQEILTIRPDMLIILCTGYSSVISEQEALAIGIKKYARKPCNAVNLARNVREVLDNG